MTRKEFIALSEQKVKELNGSTNEKAREAWRDGYMYAVEIVRKSYSNDFQEDFFEQIEKLIEPELEVFKFNILL